MYCSKCGKEIDIGTLCTECQKATKTEEDFIVENKENSQLIETDEGKKEFKKAKKKKSMVVIPILIGLILVIAIFFKPITGSVGKLIAYTGEYGFALTLMDFLNNTEAETEIKYMKAKDYLNHSPAEALLLLNELGDYADCKELAEEIKQEALEAACELVASWKFERIESYIEALGDFEGVSELRKEYNYQQGLYCISQQDYFGAKVWFMLLENYKDVDEILGRTELLLAGNTYKFEEYSGGLLYNYVYISFADGFMLNSWLGDDKETLTTKYYKCVNNVVYIGNSIDGEYIEAFEIEDMKLNEENEAIKIKAFDGWWFEIAEVSVDSID